MTLTIAYLNNDDFHAFHFTSGPLAGADEELWFPVMGGDLAACVEAVLVTNEIATPGTINLAPYGSSYQITFTEAC